MPSKWTPLSGPAQQRQAVFWGVVFFTFMQLGLYLGHQSYSVDLSDAGRTSSTLSFTAAQAARHPISRLMIEAEEEYRQRLAKQSTTLKQAVAEYKRRYKRPPPKGFEAWYEYASKNSFKLVDEFDVLMEDLDPFAALTGEEVRRRTQQAGMLPFMDLVRLEGGKARCINIASGREGPAHSARPEGFRLMLESFESILPDMDFPINGLGQGRVLVPWEHRQYPNMTVQDSSRKYCTFCALSFSYIF